MADTETIIGQKLDKLARFVQLQSADVMKHIRWMFDPKRSTFQAVTDIPLVKDKSNRLRAAGPADGLTPLFGAYEPGVFTHSYTTPTEAVRFSGVPEPGRTAIGNALSSHLAPVSQRQLESVDAYGANENSGVSAPADISQDAIRAAGRYVAPLLVRHAIPSSTRGLSGRLKSAGKKGVIAGGIAGLASGMHTGISQLRDEDYNAQDMSDALGQGALTAAAVGAGELIDPFQSKKSKVAEAMRNSLGMSLNTKIPSRDVEWYMDAMEGQAEHIPTKAEYWQRPYIDFTKKYGEAPGHIEPLPPIVSSAKGRPLARKGIPEGFYTEADIMNVYKKRGKTDEEIMQLKKSGIIKSMTDFINEHYYNPEDPVINDLFGTSRHASLETRKAAKTPIKLYPKNDKTAVKNSFVTRAHNWSVLDDNPTTREIGEMLREQYHLDEPGLDSDYRKALAEAEQRRKTMGQTAQRSKAQIITPDRYDKITAKKSPLRKGLTGLVDAAILGAANLPVFGDLIDYWRKDDKK